MLSIEIIVLSIWLITLVAWFIKKANLFSVCPICAGVSSTWLILLVISYFDWIVFDQSLIFLLIGGSVVGIAYQFAKYLPNATKDLFWKIFFIPIGFWTAFYLVEFEFIKVFIGVTVLLIGSGFFWSQNGKYHKDKSEKVEELAKQMKNCC